MDDINSITSVYSVGDFVPVLSSDEANFAMEMLVDARYAPDGNNFDGHNDIGSATGMCEEYIARHRGMLTGSRERDAFIAGYMVAMKA